jgi:hypothetical protein
MLAVPATIVGNAERDTCSAFAELPVALRGVPGKYSTGKAALTTRATLYTGEVDTDKLRLECHAAP